MFYIYQQDADIMMAPASIQSDRQKIMEFSIPFYWEPQAIIYKVQNESIAQNILFIRQFKWQVWATIGIAILVASVSLAYGLRTNAQCDQKYSKQETQNANFTKPPKKELTSAYFSTAVWCVYGVICNQGKKTTYGV